MNAPFKTEIVRTPVPIQTEATSAPALLVITLILTAGLAMVKMMSELTIY